MNDAIRMERFKASLSGITNDCLINSKDNYKEIIFSLVDMTTSLVAVDEDLKTRKKDVIAGFAAMVADLLTEAIYKREMFNEKEND